MPQEAVAIMEESIEYAGALIAAGPAGRRAPGSAVTEAAANPAGTAL